MKKPNIVWIYCDELRTDALGCYGNDVFKPLTPHIDSLAENGTLFENCFCNSPVCVPSRVSTLTGLYPEDTGVYHNEASWPGYKMSRDVVTFPEVFAENGYVTANFGKWHVPEEMNRWGHCDSSGASMQDTLEIVGRDSESLIEPVGAPTRLGGLFPDNTEYPHDILADNAINWISETEQPYLARISFLEPHTPVLPPPPFNKMYDASLFRDFQTSSEGRSVFEQRFAEVIDASNFTPEMIQLAQVYYYGLVAWVDSQVGKVLEYLKTSGQMENTIIVFDADHGASLGEGGCWAKHIFAPQTHRVPKIIQWKNTLASGVRKEEINESLDLARTLFGLAGIEAPDSFRGRDLFNEEPPEAVFSTIGFGERDSRAFPNLKTGLFSETSGWPRRACVRTAEYRLDKNVRINGRKPTPGEEDVMLVNVQADPKEALNLAGDPSCQDIKAKLSAMLDSWAKTI